MRRSDRENVIGWSLVGLASALVSARPRNARWQAGHRPAVVEASLAGRALRRLGWRRVTLIACGVAVAVGAEHRRRQLRAPNAPAAPNTSSAEPATANTPASTAGP